MWNVGFRRCRTRRHVDDIVYYNYDVILLDQIRARLREKRRRRAVDKTHRWSMKEKHDTILQEAYQRGTDDRNT